MEQRQSTAMLHLTAGVEETYVAHWFVKEGDRVLPSDPLVTLRHHHTGLTLTLRAPLSSLLTGAVLQHILRSEGTPVSATEVLAVLTSPTSGRGRGRTVAQLRKRRPATSPYTAEMGVGLVVTYSSRFRDRLFTWFPRFHRFYFRSYPLLPLLNGGVFVIIGVLSVLQIQRLLGQMSTSTASPGRDGILLFLAVAGLIPLTITILAYLIVAALRLFLLRRP